MSKFRSKRGEQLESISHFSLSAKIKKWVKNQHNKHIRREAKNIDREHPKTNRYTGWFF